MPAISSLSRLLILPALLAGAAATAQEQQDATDPNIMVTGERFPENATLAAGPEVKGIITARSGNRMKVTADDGTTTTIFINETTRVSAASGLFGIGRAKLTTASLLNGIPVTVRTMKATGEAEGALLASQVTFRNSDLRTARMIRQGTAQGFAEQTAATAALRGRMADIDQYNIKRTANVYFDTGKAALTPAAQAELCSVAAEAERMDNALLLVVGYTDSVGSQDFNQVLSERRASRVINHLQQACRWKPYRVLTPTGMAEADPLAPNDTAEGKAQNRRVAVNVLVSKAVDGIEETAARN